VRTPRFITVWHEIVNEIAGGKPISVTYCPLTGSTLVFAGELADGRATTFGTSGMLDNSNLVMYDRVTKSMWPQLLGVAVRGERKGERLREIGGASQPHSAAGKRSSRAAWSSPGTPATRAPMERGPYSDGHSAGRAAVSRTLALMFRTCENH
jgi:hypothetical protein